MIAFVKSYNGHCETNVYSFMETHENGFPWIYLGLYIP